MQSRRLRWGGFLLLLSATVLQAGSDARGDLIKLNNGGELRGTIDRKIGVTGAERVSIETLVGITVTVTREQFQFVTRRPLKVEQYESLSRLAPDTVEGQWQLAEWCQSKQLRSRQDKHLNRVLDLDPDHEEAHRLLRHVKHNGEWTTREELMAAQGFFKYKGRYVTKQELELIEEYKAEREAELKWYPEVKLWHGWVSGTDPVRIQRGILQLRQVDSPDAIAALSHFLGDDAEQGVRLLFVNVLAQMSGARALTALVTQSLRDVDVDVRNQAVQSLDPEQYPAAAKLYVVNLYDKQNDVVRRAATALEIVGNEALIPDLIETLVTSHVEQVQVPDSATSYSFAADGSYGGPGAAAYLPPDIEGALLTGQLPYGVSVQTVRPPTLPPQVRVISVRNEYRNAEVLSALRKFSHEDFGYDVRSWRLWWHSTQANGPGGSQDEI